MLVTPHNFGCISGDALCSTSASLSTKAVADGAVPYTACVGWFPEKGPEGGWREVWLVTPAVASGIAWNRATDTVRCSFVCNLKQGKVCRAVEAVLAGKLIGAESLHSSTSAREDGFV